MSKDKNQTVTVDRLEEILDHKLGLLMEHTNHKFDQVFEALGHITDQTAKIPLIERRLDTVEQDVKIIKIAVRATNKDLSNHEKRITKLETKTA